MHMPTIVAGVDDTSASHAALRVALDEAALRHARVVVVSCRSADETHEAGEHLIDRALSAAGATAKERTMIVRETSEAAAGATLVDAARGAEMLVVGSTSRGELARLTGRTTVDHCLRFSSVPVVVVPGVHDAGVTDPQITNPLADLDIEAALRESSDDSPADIPV